MIENLLTFFDSNTPLCLAFVFALGTAVSLELTKGGTKLTTNQLVQMINSDQALVVDVRQPKEYESGHIDGSINIPLAQVMDNISMIQNKGRSAVLVCENGFSVQGVGEKLRDHGLQVMRLAGGITEWRASNIPLVRGTHERAKSGKKQKKQRKQTQTSA